MSSLARVCEALAALDGPRLLLLGIGGRGCAGKSTLARALPGARIVSTDEFWDGRRFDLRRLLEEAVGPLRAGRTARFASFDWSARRAREDRVVEPEGLVAIEGVCALHAMFRDAYDLRVWVDAPRDVRLERAVARDGGGARETWESVWMPMEDGYVARDDPVACADVIVSGSDEAGC